MKERGIVWEPLSTSQGQQEEEVKEGQHLSKDRNKGQDSWKNLDNDNSGDSDLSDDFEGKLRSERSATAASSSHERDALINRKIHSESMTSSSPLSTVNRSVYIPPSPRSVPNQVYESMTSNSYGTTSLPFQLQYHYDPKGNHIL